MRKSPFVVAVAVAAALSAVAPSANAWRAVAVGGYHGGCWGCGAVAAGAAAGVVAGATVAAAAARPYYPPVYYPAGAACPPYPPYPWYCQ